MKTILFIEDERALHTMLGDVLAKEGYKMISAFDGQVGLESAKKEKPDLILLDLILPKMHGFDVLENLKKDEATKNIPVIVFTNLEGLGEIERAISLGAASYLVKSEYTVDDLLEKIKNIFK